MSTTSTHVPDYGNWVSTRIILVPAALTVAFAALSVFVIWLAIPAALSLVACAYFVYARYLLSSAGGGIQQQVQDQLLDNLGWTGEGSVLDIGCGNGPLTAKLARKYPAARVTGTDFWGGTWEYSRRVCEQNAAVEGVSDRVSFEQASASTLPYADGSFDAVVSNLTFHEVADSKDKRDVIKEALRVLKTGGAFAFQDLFGMKQTFGSTGELVEALKAWGMHCVEYVDTSSSDFIPGALKLSFMLGSIGVLRGTK